MRLETRPVARMDLACATMVMNWIDPRLNVEARREHRHGDLALYTFIQISVRNLQTAPTGFILHLVAQLRIELDDEPHWVKILEPDEVDTRPLVVIGHPDLSKDKFRKGKVVVERVLYSDVDGNKYDVAVGNLEIRFAKGESTPLVLSLPNTDGEV